MNDPLESPLSKHLEDAAFSDAELASVWSRIENRRVPRKSALAYWTPAVLGVAAALLAVWVMTPDSGPLLLAGGHPIPEVSIPPEASAQSFVFHEGSTVHLEPDTRLSPLVNRADQVSFLMTRGKAEFHVVPGGSRRWIVELGFLRVEVVGTRFLIDRGSEQAEIRVEEGTVLVFSDRLNDGIVKLGPHEALTVHSQTTPTEGRSQQPRLDVQASPPPVAPNTMMDHTPRGVDRVAEDRPRPAAVKEPLDAQVPMTPTPKTDGGTTESPEAAKTPPIPRGFESDEMLREADRARTSGNLVRAAELLEQIIQRHRGDARGALAAFTLAKLELESLHRPLEAASHFEAARTMGLPEALVEDALARQAEALWRAQRRLEAREVALEYLLRFPDGRWKDRVSAWVGE